MTSKEELAKPLEEELTWTSLEDERDKGLSNKFRNKMLRNPFVPLGALVTAGILGVGLKAFLARESVKQQKMMRYRVLAQGVTVIFISASMFLAKYDMK